MKSIIHLGRGGGGVIMPCDIYYQDHFTFDSTVKTSQINLGLNNNLAAKNMQVVD